MLQTLASGSVQSEKLLCVRVPPKLNQDPYPLAPLMTL